MITINGVKFPETKKLGGYVLKETEDDTLEVYDKNAEFIAEFEDADINTFNSVEELEKELNEDDVDDNWEIFTESMNAYSELMDLFNKLMKK